ncbi:hypothetical protein F5Y03DRAFT_408055 [Xylaria venustula]|nr:hypothetical protein F5Y03DRAFT_408055 [Xylaria venustula]
MSDKKFHIPVKSEPTPDYKVTKSTDDSKKFTWANCSETGTHERLLIKEESLEVGIKHCERLINTIENTFVDITKHSKQSAETIWPLEDRNEWLSQCREIIRDHQDFRVLVGVAGATGSGKTSILNALLGFQELLPTNNEEASTAVQCMVSFNHDLRPEYAFRCDVTFQSKEALEAKLLQFFTDLKIRDELQESHDGSAEDEEALRDRERILRPTREMISIVFGLQEEQVEKLGLEGVLNSNPEALKMLGTVKEFNGSEVEGISHLMKPYMDSTVENHSLSGANFAAWPLIDRVELFVKSDVLRNGVVLVDLPGLGDAVQSRALVAERAFNQLTATLIVTQATRAADNSTAQTFCVCLSQIDHIDRKAALRKPDARANANLQGLLAEEETEKVKLKKRRRMLSIAKMMYTQRKLSARKQKGLTETAILQYNNKVARRAAKIAKISKGITAAKHRLVELDSEIVFACILARNRYLEDRIKGDFQKRQARLKKKDPDLEKTYDGQVAICPTSSAAFWKCHCPVQRMAGFPAESYTGIPNLASWVRTATIQKREEHADDLLNRLQAQYNTVSLWSKDKCNLKDTPITKDLFEEHILTDVLNNIEQDLTTYWQLLTADVNKKNPLIGKQELVLSQCPDMCSKIVRGWAYKKPDDVASDKVHWNTYQAILSRLGEKFVSKSKEVRHEYNWMEDISHILFTTIVEDWNQSLHHDIPSLADDAWLAIDIIWDKFMTNLNKSVQNAEPRLIPELANEEHGLETIKTNAKHRVCTALGQISMRATHFRPQVVTTIQKKWGGTFEEALEIKGLGAHQARQKLIVGFAQDESKRVFKTAYNNLRKQLCGVLQKLPGELDVVSRSLIRELRRYIGVFLGRFLEPTDLAAMTATVADKRAHLQQSIIAELAEWTTEWESSRLSNGANDNKLDQIPEIYYHALIEPEQMEDNDDDLDSESDLELAMDSDSDSEDHTLPCGGAGEEEEMTN